MNFTPALSHLQPVLANLFQKRVLNFDHFSRFFRIMPGAKSVALSKRSNIASEIESAPRYELPLHNLQAGDRGADSISEAISERFERATLFAPGIIQKNTEKGSILSTRFGSRCAISRSKCEIIGIKFIHS